MATKERISLNVNNKSYDLEVDRPSVGPVRLSWMAEQCGLV